MTKHRHRTMRNWKTLIKAQLESGLNATEFCCQQQLNATYFSKRKNEQLCQTQEPQSPFVEIQTPRQTKPSANIHLQYKNAHLQIPSTVDSSWLADLLGFLS